MIDILIDALTDEQLRHIAESKDAGACRARLRAALVDAGQIYSAGQEVVKITGYPFRGVVVAGFRTLEGEKRYVVECVVPGCEGLIHIFNGDQIAVNK